MYKISFWTDVGHSFAGLLQCFQKDIHVFVWLNEDLLVGQINVKLDICWETQLNYELCSHMTKQNY